MWSPGVYIVYLPTQLVTQQDTDQEGDHKNQQPAPEGKSVPRLLTSILQQTHHNTQIL